MAPRRRVNRQNMIGNTRMDAAFDAMGQLGFEKKLVRETVDELLDVYEGYQGWPFIEEASYKLLIETILAKQQSSVEQKDNTRKDGISETTSAATPTTGIIEVGCSSLVAQDSVLHASDDLGSASQTSDHHAPPPLGNLDTDVKDATLPTESGRGIRVESKNEQRPMDNVQGSNDKTFMNNVENIIAGNSMIESSETRDELPHKRSRPCYGWIGSDNNVDLIYFPIPEHIKKLIAQSDGSQIPRRKSRWDEKPDDM